MHRLSPGAIESYERSATGLYLARGRAAELGRHTFLQAGAINDHELMWEQTDQLLTRKKRNKRTSDFELDFWLDEAVHRRERDPNFQLSRSLRDRMDARMENGFVNCAAWQRASGTLFNTYTTAKRVILDTAIWSVPPNYMVPGRKLRIRIFAAVSNIVTTPGLFNWQQRMGPVATPIAAFDTGNMQLNATAHTTLPLFGDIVIVAQVEGITTTARLLGLGTFEGIMITRTAGQTDDVQGVQGLLVPATAPAQGTGYDSTINNFMDGATGFTISNAGNGIQVHGYSLEILN